MLTDAFYVCTGLNAGSFTPAHEAFYTASVAAELAAVKAELVAVQAKLAQIPPGLFKDGKA